MTSKYGRFLSDRAEEKLIQFTAANGENFDMYLHFAEAQGWKTFTQKSYHNWIFKPRIHRRIVAVREGVASDIRDGMKLEREARVDMLERDVDRIEDLLDGGELSAQETIRLIDQKRKNLEAIAKEAGEWNKPADKNAPDSALGGLFKELLKAKQLATPEEPEELEEPPIEGEFTEMSEREPIMNADGTPYA
jgi:protein subunit release factor A